MDVLITAFTAFGKFAVNPSVEIGRGVAEMIGARLELVEVSFAAVDGLVERLAGEPPEVWVMLGVAGKATKVRVEGLARNFVGVKEDVRGEVRGPGVITAGEVERVRGRLFEGMGDVPEGAEWSEDAGDYLCNYLYWRGATRVGAPVGTRSGFVHVAPVEAMPAAEQVEVVRAVLRRAGL